MKNCKQTIDIFNHCLHILKQDQFVISDHYNNHNQFNGFKENKHDQSILSIVRKLHKPSIVYNDNTQVSESNAHTSCGKFLIGMEGHSIFRYCLETKQKIRIAGCVNTVGYQDGT
jgi:hypothetical protein